MCIELGQKADAGHKSGVFWVKIPKVGLFISYREAFAVCSGLLLPASK